MSSTPLLNVSACLATSGLALTRSINPYLICLSSGAISLPRSRMACGFVHAPPATFFGEHSWEMIGSESPEKRDANSLHGFLRLTFIVVRIAPEKRWGLPAPIGNFFDGVAELGRCAGMTGGLVFLLRDDRGKAQAVQTVRTHHDNREPCTSAVDMRTGGHPPSAI